MSENVKQKLGKKRVESSMIQVSRNSSQDTLNCTKLCASQGSRGMTSTPASKGQFLLPSLDASAVQKVDNTKADTKSHITVPAPHMKEGIGNISIISETGKQKGGKKRVYHIPSRYKESADNISGQSSNRQMTSTLLMKERIDSTSTDSMKKNPVKNKDKKKNESFNQKVAEAQMNLLYAQYLQAAFLESESKKALQMRASSALETIHKLFGLVMLHMDKARSQQRHLLIVSCLIKIHEHCQKQEGILKPVLDILPALENQYKSLAEAVNCTKHKLHVKNVLIPEPGSEDEIIGLLHKMTNFIEDFLKECSNVAEIDLSADILQNYIATAEQIADALKRGLHLIFEARDLVLSEASLVLGCES